jgi:SAM-dependent methyltransferase
LRPELVELLRCPVSGQRLTLDTTVTDGGIVESGWLVTANGARRYPIRESVPRFVPESNYSDSFGLQWNKFRLTQLDSHSGHPISANRFWKATQWSPKDLEGKLVLDAGCGAGRFAEIALGAGAVVVAFDYSTAVDACCKNLRHFPNLHVVQADIYSLPFAKGLFPFVYSLGVLQHTPDVEHATLSLPPMLAPGGRICVDFYEKKLSTMVLPKYWLRPFTKRVPKQQLFASLERLVPGLLPLSRGVARIPVAGRYLRRLVPVANYEGTLPLDERQLREWALLDTFDWLSPAFDQPQRASTVRHWLTAAGLEDVAVGKGGHLVGRGTAPGPSRHP